MSQWEEYFSLKHENLALNRCCFVLWLETTTEGLS
jgi:hypothetical protein